MVPVRVSTLADELSWNALTINDASGMIVRSNSVLKGQLAGLLLILAVLASLTNTIFLIASEDNSSIRQNLVLQIVLLLTFLLWCKLKCGTLLSAQFVFLFSIFFWHSSFLVGRYFRLDRIFEYSGSVLSYGERQVPRAVALVSLCMAFSVIGSLLAYSQHRGRSMAALKSLSQRRRFQDDASPTQPSSGLKNYAIILMGSYVLLTIVYVLSERNTSLPAEYTDVYANASASVIYRAYHMTKFLAVPIISLAIAVFRTKKGVYFTIVSTLFLMFITALTGARTMPFLYCAVLVISVDYFHRRISFRNVFLIVMAGAAVSWIMSEARATGTGMHVFSFHPSEQRISLWHIWWNSGGSIRAVLRTMEFSMGVEPLYGHTFADALMYVIPSPIVRSLLEIREDKPPSEWMLEESPDVPRGESVGMGYSLVAEAYLNYRMYGCLLFLVLGWLIAYGYYAFRFVGNRYAGLQSLNLVVLLALHLRNDSMAYARVLVWSAVIVWIGRYLSIDRGRRNGNRMGACAP